MKTPITYYGGKQRMLKHILPLIPGHKSYIEPFCGGAAVFFAKEPAPCGEVINDINQELINFYFALKLQFDELKAKIDSTLHSRDLYEHARHILKYPAFFSKVDQAWAVWALFKMSFASKQDGSFGYDRHGATVKTMENSKNSFTNELQKRLEKTIIESRDALSIINAYDTEDAFFFVDPPYIESNCGHYTGMFTSEDLEKLLEVLSNIKGKFMLTMYPNDLISNYSEAYSWTIHKIERTISASKTTRKKQEEWIICNYTMSE